MGSATSATVIIPTLSAQRCGALLDTLLDRETDFETIVVDNRRDDERSLSPIESAGRDMVRVICPERNLGYSAAVNRAASEALGDSLVLLNDDCTVEQGFVPAIIAPLRPEDGVVMAAAVMRHPRSPDLIDSAGMELDRTLLVFDYLNGEDLSILESEAIEDPVGPSGAAAAFDRSTFERAGGFDERLFAYWEDVDLVLRLRQQGGSCRLARDARGLHEHSATLGSGSARKNELMGFGRGYVLRKWSVITPRRITAVAAREIPLCIGQALIDRTMSGISGRIAGLRSTTPSEPYPTDLPESTGLVGNLRRRLRRRLALRSRHR